MRVFISWSGEPSRAVAEILRKYLGRVIQAVDVFMSEHDIGSGEQWGVKLSRELEESTFGILCLTRGNLDAPWLLFEAGALAKHVGAGPCGLLIGDLKDTDVKDPLSQFQHRSFSEEGLKALLRDLNGLLERRMEADDLAETFKVWWPQIDEEYQTALAAHPSAAPPEPSRGTQELVEEILSRIRNLERFSIQPPEPAPRQVPTLQPGDVLALSPRTHEALWKLVDEYDSKKAKPTVYVDEDREMDEVRELGALARFGLLRLFSKGPLIGFRIPSSDARDWLRDHLPERAEEGG
jgi:hypothetical protein